MESTKDLNYYKNNCEEDYINTPISVLRYITELEQALQLQQPLVSHHLSVYEYIWSKVFPDVELNYDDFYDWSRENANYALSLTLEYCDSNSH